MICKKNSLPEIYLVGYFFYSDKNSAINSNVCKLIVILYLPIDLK